MLDYKNVDEYIAAQPREYQANLVKIRQIIQKLAPEAAESISYGMSGYKYLGKPLVYFMCAKKHIGFYPTPSGVEEFGEELKDYQTSKGSIQFPHSQELPLELIKKIVEFRMGENQFS